MLCVTVFFGDRRLQECFYYLAMLVSKLNISVIVGHIPCRKNKGDIKREGKIEYQAFFFLKIEYHRCFNFIGMVSIDK